MIKRLFPIALLTISSPGISEIYKCVSPDGTVTFSNNPFCEHQQAYAKDRNEPLLTVDPAELADVPPGKIMELFSKSIDLPDLLEYIGKFSGVPIEPIALTGTDVKIEKTSHHWQELFTRLVMDHDLDYRQAYGRLYVYKVGSMGETIVHSPPLLRWYQSDETWNVVMKNDDILIGMKAYEQSELKERLPRLVKLVREDLGEEEAVNAGESVVLKSNYSGGVGSGIVAKDDDRDLRRAAEEKARRITERRQSN